METQQDQVLSFQTSQDLGIVKIVLNVQNTAVTYKTKFPKVFSGLGCFTNIKLDEATQPTVVPPRNLPATI